jgi:1-deoxy-D-xylulose-5-phosphate reductoisomerase
MKKVLILGSTGSIGINTLDVIRQHPDKFSVAALTINTRINLLIPQIKEFNPELVVVTNESAAKKLRDNTDINCKILSGVDELVSTAANCEYDILLGAMVGFAGLLPTIEAVKRGKRIALANKETLVVAGELITKLSKEYNSKIIPVDSEHSAIYQCLVGENPEEVEKLILTASGGPFFKKQKKELSKVTVKEALAHPNWKMGDKITIDSASLMNKGLEVIEARWLFGLPKEKISVVVHPQSIIHSMVEFIDGSVKAQLGMPDMRLPIQYALSFPKRLENDFPKTDFTAIKELTFFEPDLEKFQCLKLAYDALNAEGTAPCILNAANEVAVKGFLKGEISFSKIPFIIDKALEKIENHISPNLETIIECDKITRKFAEELI